QLDAVVDVVSVAWLMDRLKPRRVVGSPVHVGSGHVHTAHGVLPVPAPATARLLRGIPCYGGDIRGELCTPTGAALLSHFASAFGPMPPMTLRAVGYGLGHKEFGAANCLRAFLGESAGGAATVGDTVVELKCNLDDMTGEAIGYTTALLLKEGALDVFLTPIQMKMGRPGVLLTCLCPPQEAERFAALMLTHTTTFGVRKTVCERAVLERSTETRETAFGPVRFKSGGGHGVSREKPEYDDVAAAAEAGGQPFHTVAAALAGREE
ncbi:MAG: LarC family nickel insertion protein, partial [Methylobacteriaceae bacterium]|nr:LarC family nickel insertion protein [Methylobacteriaceae bacterium]